MLLALASERTKPPKIPSRRFVLKVKLKGERLDFMLNCQLSKFVRSSLQPIQNQNVQSLTLDTCLKQCKVIHVSL